MFFSRLVSGFLGLASVVLAPSAYAISDVGFDHALPLAPRQLELGGGAAGGDDAFSVYGVARFGLVDDLDIGARAGVVEGLASGPTLGVELEASPRFRFLRTEDTGVVDVAVTGAISFAKSSKVFAFGMDPGLVASHHFEIDDDRMLYVSAGIGVALTFVDLDAEDADVEAGVLALVGAGVDVLPRVRLSLEARIRDELQRFGLSLSYFF